MRSRRYPSQPIIGVGAVIVGKGNRVVLVKRRQEPNAGRWSLPGGALELGETLREGVRREVLEETGLVVDVGPIVEVVDYVVADSTGRTEYHFVIADYLCRSTGGTLRSRTDVDDAVWVAASDLGSYNLPPPADAVINRGFGLYTATVWGST